MLFAAGHGNAVALASSAPWRARSVGFAGTSDGWRILVRDFRLSEIYDRAEDGNVALTGEIELPEDGDAFVLALGFGRVAEEAAFNALASLQTGWGPAQARDVEGWRAWQAKLLPLDEQSGTAVELYRTSTATMLAHESIDYPGGFIASLSIP